MRAQPFHIGHEALIRQMLQECETSIILLGGANAPQSDRNPFSVPERINFIMNVFGDEIKSGNIKIGAISDLGNINLWAGYALATVWKKWHMTPDAYYCGTESDGVQFENAGLTLRNLDRTIIPVCATQIRNALQNCSHDALRLIAEQNRAVVAKKLFKNKQH